MILCTLKEFSLSAETNAPSTSREYNGQVIQRTDSFTQNSLFYPINKIFHWIIITLFVLFRPAIHQFLLFVKCSYEVLWQTGFCRHTDMLYPDSRGNSRYKYSIRIYLIELFIISLLYMEAIYIFLTEIIYYAIYPK